jgi:preprotein translocase subunit SecE
MAKDKKMPAKKSSKKPAKKNNKKKGTGGFFKKIARFFKDVVVELKKVTWPSRKNLISYTIAVIVFVVIMMAIIYGIDSGAAAAIKAIFG